MSDNMPWGPPIPVTGKPDGVRPDDLIRWSNNGRPYQEVRACDVRQWGDYDNKIMIRLGCDHPCYADMPNAFAGVEELLDAVTTLDVFFAAYPEQPDTKPLLDDDDLLTFGDLRMILRALSATSS
jgi:hypothetical protein